MGVVTLGLGLTACNNEDLPSGPDAEKGNTHVSVTLKLGGGAGQSLRALPNDYNDVGEWAGKDKISTVTIYVSDMSTVATHNFVVGTHYEVDGNFLKPLEPAAIQTTAGLKKVYVLVNATADALAQIADAGTTAGAFEAAYANVLALENSGTALAVETSASKIAVVDTDNDVIMMTNVEPQTINVEPNVDQAGTLAGANRVNMQVERAVARVMVTTAKTSYDVPSADGSTVIGSIANITWVLAQGENSLFIQRKTDWATPNWGYIPTTDKMYWDEAGAKYDYSGLFENYVPATQFGGTTVPELSTYAALNAAGDNKAEVLASLGLEANAVDGKFVLPTTHAVAAGEASSFKKGNTVYAMIRAKFTPTTFADGGTPATDGTFYLGADGKFYTTANAALDPTGTKVYQKVTKYENGKVIYYAWANPDEIPAWYNSPVLRNNIYHIHITGFKTIGTNWNPLYPEDPNDPNRVPYIQNPGYDPTDPTQPWTPGTNEPYIPNGNFDPEKPVGPDNQPYLPNPGYDPNQPTVPGENSPVLPNPDYEPGTNPDPKPFPEFTPNPDPNNPGEPIIPEEPENPIDPKDPLTTPETWMSVDVTVLPWLVHSYEVDLGI